MLWKKKIEMPHDGHNKHLCYLVNMRFNEKHFKQFKELVRDAKYICKNCGRAAADKESLCRPVRL